MVTGHLGFDVRPVRELLLGLTAGVSQTSTRFEVDGQRGLLDHRMLTASPYFSWVLFPGMWWWATATYGVGEAEMADTDQPGVARPHAGSSSLLSGALGWNVNVIDSPGHDPGSRVGVAVRGEGSLNHFRVDSSRGDMPDLEMNTWRGRVMLQGTYEQPVNDSVYLIPTLEAGVRYDGGQAASGAGVELGGRLRYEDQSVGLTLEAHGRALVPLDDTSQEWDRRRAGSDFLRPRRLRAVPERDAELPAGGIHRLRADRGADLPPGARGRPSWATRAWRWTACPAC